MKDSSRVKFGVVLFIISAFLSFLLFLQKSAEIQETKNTLSLTTVSAALNDKGQGKVRGENSAVKFEKDLETSLKIQEMPKIWLEYEDENNRVTKVEIPVKTQEFIKKRWLGTLQYSYQNESTNDREAKLNIIKNYLNDAAVYATTIDDFEIVTPFEKRKISQQEAFEIIHFVARLAIDRYEELQNMSSQINSQKVYE